MENNLIQKKMLRFMRYAGALFLMMSMVLMMRMDVSAEFTGEVLTRAGDTCSLFNMVKDYEYNYGEKIEWETVEWISSDTSIASVDQTGEMTAHKGGTAIITARNAEGREVASFEIIVLALVEKIELDSQKTMRIGENMKLSVIIKPYNVFEKTVEWSSSNPSVVSVDRRGEVTAKNEGTAVITAQATDGSGIKASCEITVLIGVKKIELDSQKTIRVGETVALSPIIEPDNASEKMLKWSSSNDSVASVDQTGKVTAKNRGKAVIIAQAMDGSGIKASCKINVLIGVKKIKLAAEKTMKSGSTMMLSAVVKPDNVSKNAIEWISSDSSVVSVNQKGKIKAWKKGKAVITVQATDGSGVKASCKITVTMGTAEAKEIYRDYYYENLKYNSKYRSNSYKLYDINQDGIPEMFLKYESGRMVYNIYTLKGKKVKKVTTQYAVNGINYNAGKKQICITSSGGAFEGYDTFYKLEGTKLKKIAVYTYISDENDNFKYYKNGKRISKSKIQAVWSDLNSWPSL